MGTVRDLWDWTPLTDAQKAHLDALAPDRRLGRAAAIEYLDRKRPETVCIKPPIQVPIAIILILIALLGLAAGFMR